MARLPAGERVGSTARLEVTLRLSANRVPLGEVPTFTAVFRQRGTRRLLVNPAAVTDVKIYTTSGALVSPAYQSVAERISLVLKRSDFVSLGRGQSHELTVRPGFHDRDDLSKYSSYVDGGPARQARLELPSGEYVVRLTYRAFPGYSASYDIDDVRNAWEGVLEAPPVRLTVLPPADDAVREAIASIDRDDRPTEAVELVRLGRVTTAVDPLLGLFGRSLELREAAADAAIAIDASRAAPALIALVAAFPERERRDVAATPVFARAIRASHDCAAVPLIVDAIEHVGSDRDVVAALQSAWREVAGRCPELRRQLVALLDSPFPVGDGARIPIAHAVKRAAEALGRVGNLEDVPQLVHLLRFGPTGLRGASGRSADLVRDGAARALGDMGTVEASAALLEQVTDGVSHPAIASTVLEQLWRLNPRGAADAMTRLLGSPDEAFTISIIHKLRQARAPLATLQLESLLFNRSATVRAAASDALLELGAAVPPAELEQALNDPDATVRGNMLTYLARHGDAASLPLFVRGITSDAPAVRRASREGIAKFGTPDTFPLLRSALAAVSEPAARDVRSALLALTFSQIENPASLADWDQWWHAHRHGTRLQWAAETLSAEWEEAQLGVTLLAARYLAMVERPPRELVEMTLRHRSWMVRDAAATVVHRVDAPRAVALLLRELDSRYLGACQNAIHRLSVRTGRPGAFDCMQKAERRRARAHWAPLARRAGR